MPSTRNQARCRETLVVVRASPAAQGGRARTTIRGYGTTIRFVFRAPCAGGGEGEDIERGEGTVHQPGKQKDKGYYGLRHAIIDATMEGWSEEENIRKSYMQVFT